MNTVLIRNLQVNDLQKVAKIHLMAFPKSALGQLGDEAIVRYYQWQLEGPHDSVSLGLYCEGLLIGFCFAGIFRGALSGFLRKNRFFLIWRVLTHPWLVVTPFFCDRLRLAWTVLTHRSHSVFSFTLAPKKSFGILAIAIDPQMQGEGYGRQLMCEIERIALKRGFLNLHLTVAVENHQAIKFYEKMGWQKLLASDSIWHGSMIKQLEHACE